MPSPFALLMGPAFVIERAHMPTLGSHFPFAFLLLNQSGVYVPSGFHRDHPLNFYHYRSLPTTNTSKLSPKIQ